MNVAFIPVRGGSKSIPLKNIKKICEKPLVYWVVRAAIECQYIDRVYVATDSDRIRDVVRSFGFEKVEVVDRSFESATDTASTESAMLEFVQKYDFDNIVLIQATSPLLVSDDLDKGFEQFATEGTDSVLSVVRQKRFNWQYNADGGVIPTNYDFYQRPRRQDFAGYLVENGAFYITSRQALLNSGCRISGSIKAVEMPEETFFEIDDPSDWLIIEALMNKRVKDSYEIPRIKMFLTDCDGCLTDGGMYYSEFGDELKKYNTRDGMGFSILREKGILTGIITSESVEINKRRAEKLQLDILELGCKDKLATVRELCDKYKISPINICYVGDDINDINVVEFAGFGCCPGDALPQVKAVAKYITKANGGEGVIREIVEKIIAEK